MTRPPARTSRPSAPAAPQAAPAAQPADRPAIPRFSDNPLGAIGFVLQSIAAGSQGRELPADRIARQQREYDQTERAQVATGIQGITLGLGMMQNVPEDQRQTFVQRYGAMLDRLAPGMSSLFGNVASQPDARELARAFGEHSDVLMPFVRGMPPAQAWETARRLISDRTLMDHLERTNDERNRPAVIARLEAIRGGVQAGVRTGLLPAEAGSRAQGIDPNVMADTIIARESGGNPNARPVDERGRPTTSATGLGQFTDSTWLGTREAPGVAARAGVPQDLLDRAWGGDAAARQQVLDARTDPQIARRGVLAFMGQNGNRLSTLGLAVTPTNLYLMGFGEGNAAPLIRAAANNPDTPVNQVVRADAYDANWAVFRNRDGTPKTAGQVYEEVNGDITQRYGQALARSGQGLSLPQFEALNSQAPQQFRMSPSELGTLRRSPDLMLSAGIVPPAMQVQQAQRAAEAQSAPLGHQIVEEGGRREILFFNQRTGQEVSRLPAGEGTSGSVIGRLLQRDPSTWSEAERTFFQAETSRGNRRTSIDPNTGTITIEEGAAAQAAPRAPEFAQLRAADTAGDEATRLITRMTQQLDQPGGVTTGLVGIGVRAVNSVADQLTQLTETLTPQQRSLLDVSRYASLLPQVSVGSAQDSARFRTNLVTLAYAIARARDPRGQVTERDISRTLSSLGTGEMLSSRDQMRAALDETARGLRESYRARHEGVMRAAPEADRREVPAWAREPTPAAAPGGQTPAAGASTDPARFRAMDATGLFQVDTNRLSDDELRAWRARVDELMTSSRPRQP